jgi:putative hydrolase
MDGVGPEVIPTVGDIRAAFQHRRESATGLEALMRRLLGLEAKLKQYADGVRFVRAVVDEVGMAGFNKVWDAPAALPSLAELHDPGAWVARVHPAPALPPAP